MSTRSSRLSSQPSSSSSSREAGRKRPVIQILEDGDEDEDEDNNYINNNRNNNRSRRAVDDEEAEVMTALGPLNSNQNLFNFNATLNYDPEKVRFQIKEKEANNFLKLSADAQKQCVRTVVRLFLFKGTRRETITRLQVADALGKIDLEYKKHVNAVLARAQGRLLSITGYQIVSSKEIIGYAKDSGKKSDTLEYYLCNATLAPTTTPTTTSPEAAHKLAQILLQAQVESSNQQSTAYLAFLFVIFHALLNGPATGQDLLRMVRKVDARFPETWPNKNSNDGSGVWPVLELEEDFVGLLTRMRKERYLIVSMDEKDSHDLSRGSFDFGPRFHLEIGKKNLLLSYYALLEEPVDKVSLKEVEDEINLIEKSKRKEEDEE